MDTEIQVSIHSSHLALDVGVAHFHRGRASISTTFTYLANYLAHPQAYAIDPGLPLTLGAHHVRGIPGAFLDSAPDRWGRNLLDARHRFLAPEGQARLRSLDEVDYFLGVDDTTRQGALRFSPPGVEFSETKVPPFVTLGDLLAASRAIMDIFPGGTPAKGLGPDSAQSHRAIKLLLDAGTGSLGGARPKASLLNAAGELSIAKFPHIHDTWNVMGFEAMALDIASRVGLPTPARELVSLGHHAVLVLERFDRSAGARLGYISAMTLTRRGDGEAADYVDIAQAMTASMASPTSALHQLFDRVVLNVALNNTDDHLRNHGFVRTKGGWALSPVFDINPDPRQGTTRRTSIAGAFGDDSAEGLEALAGVCRLTPREAGDRIRQIAQSVSHWEEIAIQRGVNKADRALLRPVIDFQLERLGKVAKPPARSPARSVSHLGGRLRVEKGHRRGGQFAALPPKKPEAKA